MIRLRPYLLKILKPGGNIFLTGILLEREEAFLLEQFILNEDLKLFAELSKKSGLGTGSNHETLLGNKKTVFKDPLVNFTDSTFHHIFDVCRQGIGAKFEILTGDGYAHSS